MEVFDGRDTECPDLMLAIRTKLASMSNGEHIYITTRAKTSVANLKTYCNHMGHSILKDKFSEAEGDYQFMIAIGEASSE